MNRGLLLALLLTGGVWRTLEAHHAFSPVYDQKRTVTIEGVVTEFRFVNPHSMMTVTVRDAEGKDTTWIVECNGRLNLSEVGWTAKSITTGERVTVTGNPAWEPIPRMFFRRLVRANGTILLPGNAQRAATLEEERRQRARARDQKK